MYRSVSYISRLKKMRLFTWDKNGDRIHKDISYFPYFYVRTSNPKKRSAVSIFNDPLKKIVCNNAFERKEKIKDLCDNEIFENINPVQQFIIDQYCNSDYIDNFDDYPLRVMFLDIEVYSPNEFPTPDNSKYPINIITIYDSFKEKYYVWGLKEYKSKSDNIVYHHSKDEKSLLLDFLLYYKNNIPDILSGWSSNAFDIPYIVNRIGKVLGKSIHNILSPMCKVLKNPVYKRFHLNEFQQKQDQYTIEGVNTLDYLELYREFTRTITSQNRDSYKLDHIAKVENIGSKVDIGKYNHAHLADNDWNKFVEYNIQDVALVKKLDDKIKLLDLIRILSYVGFVPFKQALGTVNSINGIAVKEARKRGKIIPTFKSSDKINNDKYEGAYVSDPIRGFQNNIVSYDVNSLYPSILISLNLSPETKYGSFYKDSEGVHLTTTKNKKISFSKENFYKFIKDAKLTISTSNVLWKQADKNGLKGIIPSITDYFYNVRREKKDLLIKYKNDISKKKKELKNSTDKDKIEKEIIDIEKKKHQADLYQMTFKIFINKIYGYFGNKHAPMGDIDIASSISITGQEIIKKSNDIIKKYFVENSNLNENSLEIDKTIIYNDTDSAYINISNILDYKNVELQKDGVISPEVYKITQDIEDYLNENIKEWAITFLNSNDPRFVFKRESICDKGLFLQKKRYVLHKLDDEGASCNDFKYVGVEVVRTTIPTYLKPFIKGIVENMIMTQNANSTDKLLLDLYDKFSTMPLDDISFSMNVNKLKKYEERLNGFSVPLGTPFHIKSALFYNKMISDNNLDNKYEIINPGDKIKYFYTRKNVYGLNSFGYKDEFPKEFEEYISVDRDKMFDKIVFESIKKYYETVNWEIRKPDEKIQTNLFDFFGE